MIRRLVRWLIALVRMIFTRRFAPLREEGEVIRPPAPTEDEAAGDESALEVMSPPIDEEAAEGETEEEDEEEEEEEDKMDALRGKALFVRQIRQIDTDPIRAARKVAGWGFRWVAPTIMWSGRPGQNRTVAFYTELTKLGVGVVPDWLLPARTGWEDDLKDYFAFVDRLRRAGVPIRAVMTDPERDFRGHPDAAEAFGRAFFQMARERGLLVVVTSYAVPPADFPAEIFARYSDAVVAQTYTLTSGYGADIFTRAIERWRARGYGGKTVILAAAFWDKYRQPEPRTKTPTEWAEFLAAVPPTPGLIIWPNQSWGGPVAPLLSMFKDWRLPGVVPLGAQTLLVGLPFGQAIADAVFGG